MSASLSTDLSSLKVTDLRSLLAEKGLPTSGKKTELIERLQAADQSALEPSSSSGGGPPEAPAAEAPAAAACAAPATADAMRPPRERQPEIGAHAATASVPATSPAAAVITPDMTEEEKLAARKAKFGIKTDLDKLQERARRFGTFDPTLEEEKKKLRAQRFGLPSTPGGAHSSSAAADEEAERRKKRAERFGIVDEEERKRRRAERFGILSEEEKLQKRLQRFAGSATA